MEGTQQTTAALIGKLLLFIYNSHDLNAIHHRLDQSVQLRSRQRPEKKQ